LFRISRSFILKKIRSLTQREVPQIRRRIATCNTFATRKTLAAHCTLVTNAS
jgi:hypothetical protein